MLPRPPHSPPWLNPGETLEGSINPEPTTAITGKEQADLPIFRFGRGERPDAEDEPESEDELPLGERTAGYHHLESALGTNPVSPTILKQLQAMSYQDSHQDLVASSASTESRSKLPHNLPPPSPSQQAENKAVSPSVNSGDIPFGSESGQTFSSQLFQS